MIIGKNFVCDKEGIKVGKIGDECCVKQKCETGNGCKAKMWIAYDKGIGDWSVWRVNIFLMMYIIMIWLHHHKLIIIDLIVNIIKMTQWKNLLVVYTVNGCQILLWLR